MYRKTLRIVTLVSAALVISAALPAFADKDNKTTGFPDKRDALPARPAPSVAAVPDIAVALDALQADPALAELVVDWAGVKAYYATHGNAALWTTANGYSIPGQAWIVQLPRAVRAGLALPQSALITVAGMTPPTDSQTQARAEALMSAVFVASAIDAASPIGLAQQRGAGILDAVASVKDPGAFMNLQWPSYYRFWSLYAALPKYVSYYLAGGWPAVPKVDKLEPGQSNAIVPALRARLLYSGELTAATHIDNVYDPELETAVATFQRNHGLNDDGVVGARTLEEMNVSAEKRVQMILLNLDRMRQQGGKFEQRHLIVNIPSQEAKVIDDGKVVFYSPAIVGKVDRKTPILDSVIKLAKFNPEWNAPAKIASNDEVRRARADPSFLTSHGFHVYDTNGMEVDIDSIDWHSVGPGNFPYRLVQEPGPENALGPVKLDFPNPESVYLHGTNQRQLFAKQDRYFSSGCMRLQRPIEMAAFLLSDDENWQRPRIDQVVEAGKTVLVPLKTQMPIHVVYMTAWVDEDGTMQFRRDTYKYDKYTAIPAALAPAAASSNLVVETAPAAKVGKSD